MGGGHEGYRPSGHHYFKEVWSPSGGWWCDPKGWRRNTAIAAGLFMAANYLIFSYSSTHEKRYLAPKQWVPSMLYVKKYPDPPSESS
ncbi:MAG: hypothetical protein J3K34DRAFT_445160 [Monoraphidium minutum]|nr:MAG: hypothetical protein J3K34DRAFT_445160 [Monoraphidium minutum]